MNDLQDCTEMSVILPVHITHESQITLFERALASVAKQKSVESEIIITTHRSNNRIIEILQNYASRIDYQFYDQAPLGISKNTNFAVSKARGMIVKILYQDDYLVKTSALRRIRAKLQSSNSKWYVTASKHLYENEKKARNKIIPVFNTSLLQGVNRVSGPSVSAFYRNSFVPFSENLHLLLDCEWYVRMIHNFGIPYIDSRVNVVNGVHAYQAQKKYGSLLECEKAIASNMHSYLAIAKAHTANVCKCLQQTEDGLK